MGNLQSFFQKNRRSLLVFVCVLAVYGVSCYGRLQDYHYWMQHREDYVVDNVVAMSEMDSYYWLKMARELDEGLIGKGKVDPIKGYPDGVPFAIKDSPSLLAELISFGKNFTGGDYYRSGLMLIVVLAGLFVFPLFFYFRKLGYGASAFLGGLIGSFSHAYYDRTMMGRVDTDLLNTFFPLAVASFILAIDRDRRRRANLGLAIGAGVTMYLYNWWYQQPSFILVYLLFMTIYLIASRIGWKQIALIIPLFLLASGPNYLRDSVESVRTFLWVYFSPPPMGQIVWPDIMKTIQEARYRGLAVNIETLYGFRPVVFAGFAGLVFLYVRCFRQMIPISPLILLGAWSLVGPNRFVMYLSPFVGVGVGVLIEVLIALTIKWVGKTIRSWEPLGEAASISSMAILFISTTAYTGFGANTAPLISPATIKTLLDIKRIVPKHSAMFTPFFADGYPLMEIGDFATYHDGGLQGGIRSTLAAKAVTSSRQKDMVSFLSYLEDHGFNGLSAQISKGDVSADKMMALVFEYPGEFRGKNVYVLYLEDMIWKFNPMSYLGTWDFDERRGDPMDYVQIPCFYIYNNIMTCSDGTIDLNSGIMSHETKNIPLQSAQFVNDGYVVNQKTYKQNRQVSDKYYLEVLMRHGELYITVVADERLYWTNFNQQYLLGNYDRRYFEEVYNEFPAGRLFRVKTVGAANSPQ